MPVGLIGNSQRQRNRKRDIGGRNQWCELSRKWVRSSVVRIHERGGDNLNLGTPGRTVHHIIESLYERRLVEDAPSTADGSFAVAANVIGETEARAKEKPTGLKTTSRAARIASKEIPVGRIRKF